MEAPIPDPRILVWVCVRAVTAREIKDQVTTRAASMSLIDHGVGSTAVGHYFVASGQVARLGLQPLADDASARPSTTAALTKFLLQRRFMGTPSEVR
jgi:hypothetical protein